MSGAGNSVAKSSLSCPLCAGAAILAGLLLLPAAAQSATRVAAHTAGAHQTGSRQVVSRQVVSRPHVYLMRGLLNVFSLGMDQLAAQIQSHGIDASVYNHTFADVVVARIVQTYRAGDHGPYMLVGHSLGADAVMGMAQALNAQGVPVALVVPVDGTGSYAASRNVACVINLTQRKYAYMRAAAGFHGVLSNVDFSGDPGIDHLTIDKSPRVQAEALRYVLETARAEACRPGGADSIVAQPREAPAPKLAKSKPATPKLATPRLASPRLATPRPASPRFASPAKKMATPAKTASPELRPGLAG
jgi:cell division septation protein DedD